MILSLGSTGLKAPYQTWGHRATNMYVLLSTPVVVMHDGSTRQGRAPPRAPHIFGTRPRRGLCTKSTCAPRLKHALADHHRNSPKQGMESLSKARNDEKEILFLFNSQDSFLALLINHQPKPTGES